ncbi:hypothetical protein CYLTODRAFT_343035 [Cylindrobasidium torrendii FP15055 ss-10]|uniref:Uncharacterized protein n=1 Tax=Cylindrobasidium torrendii FP15055 ss-10 TaxID=1314674 RepID=A0A0D7BS64_9AGAR|nr:hypothetical protein CYLTODRAFT_343035 [Cylindrobasidium torrendii FP15055 ss-10]
MFAAAFLQLALALTVMGDSWGPAYSLGPTASAIIESTVTFNPGTPPANPKDALFLWPGISNATSGLIQSGADQLADQNAYCGATDDQWCVMASYFGVVDGTTTQLNGAATPVDANTPFTIHYKLQDDQITWDQTVTLNGEVISTLQSSDGPLISGGWGTGTECQSDCTGTTSAQTYSNITIVLQDADMSFSNTLGKGEGVEASELVTADNGKTWTIESITIPAMVEGQAVTSESEAILASTGAVPSSTVVPSGSTARSSFPTPGSGSLPSGQGQSPGKPGRRPSRRAPGLKKEVNIKGRRVTRIMP